MRNGSLDERLCLFYLPFVDSSKLGQVSPRQSERPIAGPQRRDEAIAQNGVFRELAESPVIQVHRRRMLTLGRDQRAMRVNGEGQHLCYRNLSHNLLTQVALLRNLG